MTIQNPISMAATHCGACNHSNASNAQFCAGCGQSLHEPCAGCGKPALLTQRFCASCGVDLEQPLQAKHAQHEQWIGEAVAAAKDHEFDHAIAMLQRVANLTDHRFSPTAERAAGAIEKVNRLKERSISKTEELRQRAKTAFENQDRTQVIGLLGEVPSRLLDSESKQMLAICQSFVDQVSALETELRAAWTAKKWGLVGSLVNQLLDMLPDDPRYRKLAEQISAELVASARRKLAERQYEAAIDCLQSVPSTCRDEEFETINGTIEKVHWLSNQFDPEPYVTPMLGRLAVRFTKDSAKSETAQELVKQLAARLKEGSNDPRIPSPTWKGSPQSWLGGDAAILGFPQSVAIGGQPQLKQRAGRFTVAIGLALQGLGRGRVTENFAPKQGIFASIGRRKTKMCWGIDIGSAGIKAVCLEHTGAEKLAIVDSYFCEFESPLCRKGESLASAVVREAIGKMTDEVKIGDTPVWANLAASNLISRFVRLPPVKDKRIDGLIDQELEQTIPLPAEDIDVVRWVASLCSDHTTGRPAVISAARKVLVASRLDLLKEAGLKVSGLQADPIAIVNFAAHEFADLWCDEADAHGDHAAVAIIDSGAASTSLLLISRDAHWFRTIETGGEDLTSLLARSTQTIKPEAEKLKCNVAALESPPSNFAPIEQRMNEVRLHIEKMMSDAQNQSERFDVLHSWCVGGTCLTHGWIRRVMLGSQSSNNSMDAA